MRYQALVSELTREEKGERERIKDETHHRATAAARLDVESQNNRYGTNESKGESQREGGRKDVNKERWMEYTDVNPRDKVRQACGRQAHQRSVTEAL